MPVDDTEEAPSPKRRRAAAAPVRVKVEKPAKEADTPTEVSEDENDLIGDS